MNDLVRGSLDAVILALLEERPDHGYSLMQRINRKMDADLSDGSLYPALQRLEAAGKIEGEWELAVNGRKRKIFSVTSKGRGQLARARAEWPRVQSIMSSILGEAGA